MVVVVVVLGTGVVVVVVVVLGTGVVVVVVVVIGTGVVVVVEYRLHRYADPDEAVVDVVVLLLSYRSSFARRCGPENRQKSRDKTKKGRNAFFTRASIIVPSATIAATTAPGAAAGAAAAGGGAGGGTGGGAGTNTLPACRARLCTSNAP